MWTAGDSDDPNDWIKCVICRQQNSFSGVAHWKWHQFCRVELNPIAMLQFVERQRLGEAGDRIVKYIVAVTGMDFAAVRIALAEEAQSVDAVDPHAGSTRG